MIKQKYIFHQQNFLKDYFEDNSNDAHHYTQFFNKITTHIANNTTIKTIKINYKNKIPYITHEIKKMITERDKLYKQHKIHPNNILIKKQFLRMRNKINIKLRMEKRAFISSRISDVCGDGRKTWKIINECIYNRPIKNSKSNPTSIVTPDNQICTNTKDIASHFNDFFLSVSNEPSDCSYTNDINLTYYSNDVSLFKFSFIDIVSVFSSLNNLKEHTSPGYDQISVKILKSFPTPTLHTYVDIINNIISTCIYPNELKISKIIPIYKSGKKDNMSNYRPIHILPTFSKLIESLLYDQLMEHLEENNYLSSSQYGFRKKSGTLSACVDLVENLQQSIDKKYYTATLFVDLKKAFDSVDHNLLFKKLNLLKISDEAIKLLKSFLNSRKQYVEIDGKKSETELSTLGVPQGSKFSSLFFLVFIDDIFKVDLKGKMILYADDIALTYSCKKIEILNEEMQYDLNKLKTYLSKNLLKLNTKKTNYIIFKKNLKNYNFQLFYDNEVITKANEVTYLGLKINNNLNWGSQIDVIKKKIVPFIGVIRRIKYTISQSALWKIYYAHIYSQFGYLAPIWANAPKKKLMN